MPAASHASASFEPIRIWLFAVAALVFVMVSVGGATRLTDSGLSITEWQPIMGAIPPLNDAQWHEAFEKYRQIPEYKIVNRGMSLDQFKFIFWWEWGHRLLGRLIGVVFAVPLLWFWWRGRLSGALGYRLLGLLALGALQGAVGWYMVQSGLVGSRVDVAPYRLAMHLTLAIVILGLLVWIALGVGESPRSEAGSVTRTQRHTAFGMIGLLLLQIVAGALVAGSKAGLTFNTWPMMDGQLVPSGLMSMTPWYLSLFEDHMTVQFNHRILAYALMAVAIWHAFDLRRSRAAGPISLSASIFAGAVFAQAALGIWTLLWVVPIGLGLAHQSGAAALFCLAIWHVKRVSRARASA